MRDSEIWHARGKDGAPPDDHAELAELLKNNGFSFRVMIKRAYVLDSIREVDLKTLQGTPNNGVQIPSPSAELMNEHCRHGSVLSGS